MTPQFILRRGDRLAARLRHILYAWRFTRQLDAQLLVNWSPRDHSVYDTIEREYYGLSLILNLSEFYTRRLSHEIVFFEGRFARPKTFTPFPPSRIAAQLPNSLSRNAFADDDSTYVGNSYVLQFADETGADVRRQVREMFRTLPVNAAVERAWKAARKQLGPGYVALHVRRGDIVDVLRAATGEFKAGQVTDVSKAYATYLVERTAPFAWYLPEVEAALAGRKKVLFLSDTPATISAFQDRFGIEAIVDGRLFGNDLPHPLQKAFLDFLLLGSGTQLIGTQTGFASFAAELCGADFTVVSARGTWPEFQRFLYDDVLLGETLPDGVRTILETACIPEYERLHRRAVRSGLALPRGVLAQLSRRLRGSAGLAT